MKKPKQKRSTNMKKWIVLLSIIGFIFSASSSFAGQKQRHRWEGVAMGLGAVILGNALINSNDHCCPPPRRVYYYPPPVVRCPPPCRDPYVRAYEQERERLRRQEQYRWEQEMRQQGINDAREDYYNERR